MKTKGKGGTVAHVRGLVVLLLATLSTAHVRGGEYALENESVRFVLRDNRIASLFDKLRSIEHASPQTASSPGVFNLQLVQGTQPVVSLDATQMSARVLRATTNSLELEFTHAEATVRLRVGLPSPAGELACALAVTPSNKDLAVGSVACPVVETPSSVDGETKNCLLPLYEGRLHPVNVTMIEYKPKVYPAWLFAQMVACLGPKGGFLLWCDDTTGQVKEFKYGDGKTGARFAIIHRMPHVPGTWESGYQTHISFSGPAWQDAADIYRSWASRQPWCATRFRDRKDMPAFLHHPHFHATVQLGREEDLESVPERLKDLGGLLGAPIIVRGTYWEKRGGWVGIDYFPPGIGEERLRAFAASLKARDIRLICEIAGYRWLKGDEKSPVISQMNKLTEDQKEELRRYFDQHDGQAVCEMGPDGKLNPSTTLCRGSPTGRRFLQEMAARLFDLGLTTFDCDSDVGPSPDGVGGCFNAAHGHPIPCGTWSTENTRTAFREIRAEAARRGISDLFLMKEHCTELLNMEIHAYLSRLSHVCKEPHVVPLTQYLYHEYLPILLYNSFPDELNDILIHGQIPGGSPLLAKMPVLQDYYRSMRGHAKDFLLYGRMLRPMILEVPVRRTVITDKKSGKTAEMSVPLVRNSAWADGSGAVGVFAINTQKNETTVSVNAPAGGPWQATVYLGDSQTHVQALAVGEVLPWCLPPGRLASIVFKPANER